MCYTARQTFVQIVILVLLLSSRVSSCSRLAVRHGELAGFGLCCAAEHAWLLINLWECPLSTCQACRQLVRVALSRCTGLSPPTPLLPGLRRPCGRLTCRQGRRFRRFALLLNPSHSNSPALPGAGHVGGHPATRCGQDAHTDGVPRQVRRRLRPHACAWQLPAVQQAVHQPTDPLLLPALRAGLLCPRAGVSIGIPVDPSPLMQLLRRGSSEAAPAVVQRR